MQCVALAALLSHDEFKHTKRKIP
uniref:Uncharacterized protein n=1 Tax=Rhizophora mucronata TaxID=61149 RepID=A0A2P2QFT6_RHIMU